jgi:hypothetical protein
LFAQADLSLGNALLCGLMFAAAMIRLLLGAPVGYFSLQRQETLSAVLQQAAVNRGFSSMQSLKISLPGAAT